MVDLNDVRTEKIAEVLANKTCKKILSLLAEKEFSAGDLSERLHLPLNTIGYNLENLSEAGLIEKAKGWFWSSKGRKIVIYKLSNKRIVISPKSSFRGVIPTVLITGLVALGIRLFVGGGAGNLGESYAVPMLQSGAADKVAAVASNAASGVTNVPAVESGGAIAGGIYSTLANAPNSWSWFFLGALTGLLIFLLWNWRKK